MSDSQGFNLEAFLPALIISIFVFIFEFVLSTFIVATFLPAKECSPLTIGIIFLAIFLLCEILHRIKGWFYRAIIWLGGQFSLIRALIGRLLYGKDCIFYIIMFLWVASTFILCFHGGMLFIKGMAVKRMPMPSDSFIGTGITTVAGFLSIFFAVGAIVAQNILQKYSRVFLNKFVSNYVFVVSFILFAIFIIGGFWLSAFGVNEPFIKLSYWVMNYVVVDMVLMIALLVYFANPENLVLLTLGEIKKHVRSLRPVELVKIGLGPDADKEIERKKRHWAVKDIISTWLLGESEIQNSFIRSFKIPLRITNSLRNDLRPIISTCLKAIEEDNRELFLSCLRVISEGCCLYLERRKNYQESNDAFLSFVRDQLEVVYSNAIKAPNQQFTADIVGVVFVIGIKSVDSPGVQGHDKYNGLVFGWISFLEKSVFNTLHLQHTSAAADAIQSLSKLAVALVQSGATTSGVYGTGKALATIAKNTGTVNNSWLTALCQSAVIGLVSIVDELFNQIRKDGWGDYILVKNVCENLEDIMAVVYKNEKDLMSYRTISAPLVGGLWQNVKLTNVLYKTVSSKPINSKAGQFTLSQLDYLVETLRRAGAGAILHNREDADDYFQSFAEMTHAVIHCLLVCDDKKDKDYQQAGVELLNKLIDESVSLLTYIPDKGYYDYSQYLYHISPVVAFLTYYSNEVGINAFYNPRNRFIERLVKWYHQLQSSQNRNKHQEEIVYRYLKLFGAWIYRYSRKDKLVIEVTMLLAKNYEKPDFTELSFSEPGMEYFGYPTEHLVGFWFIYPSEWWTVEEKEKIAAELNDLSVYKEYDAIISRLNRKQQHRHKLSLDQQEK